MTTTTKPTKDSAAAKEPKVIKRYANRKLYDTERSCYVTLEEISQMIKDGDDVKVVDNKTKDDLTAVTLAQIIVEEEKKVQKMPLKLLRSIIQSGNEAIGELYQDKVADPVKRLRDDVQTRVDALFKRDGKSDEPGSTGAPTMANGSQAPASPTATTSSASTDTDASNEVKAGVVKEFVHSTTEAFETWQKRIDERVRDTLQKTLHRPDLEALKARVEALEARIRDVESRKKAP